MFTQQTHGGGAEGLEGSGVEAESFDDVFPYCRGGCRGKADQRDRRVSSTKVGKVSVSGAEVMAPFGDAMGFVNGDARKFTLAVDGREVFTEGFGQGVLWGDVEEASQRMTSS